jgi:glycosyltransferase involved in cell wall biosynthesis
MSQNVQVVTSNSEYVLRRHQSSEYFHRAPSEVIFNIAKVTRSSNDRPASLVNADFVFGYIGRIELEKGIEVVLEATRLIKNGNWRLRIAGRGLESYVRGLKEKYKSDRIEWLGFADPADFYSSVDTVIVSSIWPEPLPRTLIEAYSHGKSAICARSGGIPEISSLGLTYAQYNPASAPDLAALMEAALVDPVRWRHGGFVDDEAPRAFSEETIVARFSALYGGLCA